MVYYNIFNKKEIMGAEIHRIINTIMVVLSLGASMALLYFLFTFWKTIIKPEKTNHRWHDKYSVKEDSIYNLVVQKILCQLKKELNATKIILGRFHNGGNYVNGLPMKKFSLTHETAGGTETPMMDKGIAVLNSKYSEAFAQLATIEEYCIADIEDCTDDNFKRDMKVYGFKAAYLFLIRQFNGKEDGFVGVYFNRTTVVDKEHRHMVIEQIPRIMGLLNMEKEQLKEL